MRSGGRWYAGARGYDTSSGIAFVAFGTSARLGAHAGEALCSALNGLAGGGFEASVAEGDEGKAGKAGEPGEPGPDAITWRQPFAFPPAAQDSAETAQFWLVAGKDLWDALGQMVLGGAGAEAASEEDCRSTWNEIAGQTMGGLARSLSAELKHEILAQDGGPDAGVPDEQMQALALEVRHGSKRGMYGLRGTRQFAQRCVIPAATRGRAETVQGSSGEATSGKVAAIVPEASNSKTLDLLMDVSLAVRVSFGKTSLQLREVLKLNTGSVVELDRLVSEPVEVIVNNCVIARGEVVVVDGNYGVRVIHLASRADRLRSGAMEASSRLGVAAG